MKRVVLIVAVVAALVAATLAGLWLGNRSTTPATTTTSSSSTPTPTTATASEILVGTVAAGEGGSLPGPGTLKVGYPHTQDGAVAALTNYLTAAFDKSNLTDPAYRTALVNAIAVDEVAKPDLLKGVEGSAKTCASYGVCRVEPRRGAYAVHSYGEDKAEIALWIPITFAEPVGSTRADVVWGISTHRVFWSSGDWKVGTLGDDGVTDDSTTALLVPTDRQASPTRAEKAAILTTPRGGTVALWSLQWKEYANAVH